MAAESFGAAAQPFCGVPGVYSGAIYDSSSGFCTINCTNGDGGNCGGSGLESSTAVPQSSKDSGGGCAGGCGGDPIVFSIANKFQPVVDFTAAGANRLRFVRTYNSTGMATVASGFGQSWMHNYASQILQDSATKVSVSRSDGKSYAFTYNGAVWSADADVSDVLVQTTSGGSTTGWQYTVAQDDSFETYDLYGNLSSVTYRDGKGVAMAYRTGSGAPIFPAALVHVTDTFGHTLTFNYALNGNLVSTFTDSNGGLYTFNFASASTITEVTYPDTFSQTYVYNEAAYTSGENFPTALTGLIDENGSRYSTTWYDASQNAVQTVLNGGVYDYAISNTFDGSGRVSTASVTDPLGTVTPRTFVSSVGRNRLNSIQQPAVGASPAAAQTMTFDTNGNIASQTDFDGHLTCHVYDSTKNLETGRVEGMAPGSTCPSNIASYTTAAGTVERKTLTQLHAVWHLPVKVAEPLRITTYVYNGDGGAYCAPTSAMVGANHIGVLCSKTEQATTDATGSLGFSATATGTARVWSYTYNQYGQVLTAKNPLNNTTTNVYYAATDTAHSPPWYYMGDLDTVKDALNHTTTYTQYDGNGRLLSMTDPNGVITTMTYKPRGWLATKVVTQPSGGAETTAYGYDNVGQLTKVTMPDGTYIEYTYDPAHRLTKITDSAGDTITYTLDNMGNRTAEATKDPSNNLTRNVARVYDALNRLSSVTGALQ